MESSRGKTCGPVNTAEEKRLIGDIAINIGRLEDVDNQLEVK
jgi:hypothetical protein